MLNITRKLVLFTVCGALMAGGSVASQASNVYNAAPSQADEVGGNNPVSAPAEVPPTFAKAGDQATRTDATLLDTPEQSSWSLENEQRYYDYSRVIMGD